MSSNEFLQTIDRLIDTQSPRDDATCLRDYLSLGDERAFTNVVAQYGPMVFGVCRRLLGNTHDAEDAFQNVFLVLSQRLPGLNLQQPIAPWLYRVAYLVAKKSRYLRMRTANSDRLRPRPEQVSVKVIEPDFWELIDTELFGLSESLRQAVVLCDLKQQSHSQAATALGIPKGTLTKRLQRAHQALAKRLAKKGLTLEVAALATGALMTVPGTLQSAAVHRVLIGDLPATEAMILPGERSWGTIGSIGVGISLLCATIGGLFFAFGQPGNNQAADPGPKMVEHKEQELPKVEPKKDETAQDFGSGDLIPGCKTHFASLSISPSGRYAALGGYAGEVLLWDLQTKKEVWSIQKKLFVEIRDDKLPKNIGGNVATNSHCNRISVSFHPEEKLIAVAAPDGVKLHEVENGKEQLTIPAAGSMLTLVHENGNQEKVPGRKVQFSPDGKMLLVQEGTHSAIYHLFKKEWIGKYGSEMAGPGGYDAWPVAWAPRSDRILHHTQMMSSGLISMHHSTIIRNEAKDQVTWRRLGGTDFYLWSNDGQKMVLGGREIVAAINPGEEFDQAMLMAKYELPRGGEKSQFICGAISPDSQLIALGMIEVNPEEKQPSYKIEIRDLATMNRVHQVANGLTIIPRSLSFAKDGQKLYIAGGLRDRGGFVAMKVKKIERPNIDEKAWGEKLRSINDKNWREAFAIGCELADLPAETGYRLLKQHWGAISSAQGRAQVIKAFYYQPPAPYRLRLHDELLKVLDLGVNDASREVQDFAWSYLCELSINDFAAKEVDYPQWKKEFGSMNARLASEQSILSFVKRWQIVERRNYPTTGDRNNAELRLMKSLELSSDAIAAVPEARTAINKPEALSILLSRLDLATQANAKSSAFDMAICALSVIKHLELTEGFLSKVSNLCSDSFPHHLRVRAIAALGGKQNQWATRRILSLLESSMPKTEKAYGEMLEVAVQTLVSHDNPRAIPHLIGLLAASDHPETKSLIGQWALPRLTKQEKDTARDANWWKEWWLKNRATYPEGIRKLDIPKMTIKLDVDDPLEDVKHIPSKDTLIAGDANKRYFFIGPKKDAKEPKDGFGLVVVLPGGPGSADFNPFVRRIYDNAIPQDFVIAQVVAPKWDEKQFNQVVWPTDQHKYEAAKFTTEELIEATLKDVQAIHKIDPKRLYLLGWSSSGPALYSMMNRKKSPFKGAMICMSVFREASIENLENPKEKAFYLYQSPDDKVTPYRFAEAAEKALGKAGAKVKLTSYQGGHGWVSGQVNEDIAAGIKWLSDQK